MCRTASGPARRMRRALRFTPRVKECVGRLMHCVLFEFFEFAHLCGNGSLAGVELLTPSAISRCQALVVVFFALVPHGRNGNCVFVVDLEKRDVTRVSERDQQLSPAGVFL